jgi:hypothetical protein
MSALPPKADIVPCSYEYTPWYALRNLKLRGQLDDADLGEVRPTGIGRHAA